MKLPKFGVIPRFATWILVLLASGTLSWVLSSFQFNRIESVLYDLRVKTGPQPDADSRIVLIGIDETSIKTIEQKSISNLSLHNSLLERLEEAKPLAVGYLANMNHVLESDPSPEEAELANQFVRTGQRMIDKKIPFILGTAFDVTGEVVPTYPLNSLPHALSIVHKDGNVFSEDQVTRRALHHLNAQNSFHIEMAKRILGTDDPAIQVPGMFHLDDIDATYFFFRYHGRDPYPLLRWMDVVEGRVPPSYLEGKIVLVGTINPDDNEDYTFTPFDHEERRVPKLVIHGNILDAVLNQNTVIKWPREISTFISLALVAFIFGWVLSSAPLTGILSTGAMIVSVLVLGQALYAFAGIWLHESAILIGIFLAYYLAVPYRLVTEFRKRWEFQRQNELLKQVEELKTNFMSLVTHDLKTPVARIQGLAEMLIRKAEERLNDRDKQTLKNILSSTDELNKFITSILELNKIESHQLRLQIESKDINQIIEKSVGVLKPLAKAKGIKIQSDLEPLFPIRVDANLISKVINNLIDNAIKYSPNNSEVIVRSREIDTIVEVSVQDQGFGMTEQEISQLFTRFYRADNDTTKSTIGTGLGLYLTKYFIEAHQGKVFVESIPGKGSIFKIQLPIHTQIPAIPGLKTSISHSHIEKGTQDHVQSTRS